MSLSKLDLNRYPDPAQREVKALLAKMRGVRPEQIFVGVGSDEAIDLLIRIFCVPGEDSILIMPPSYGMYKVRETHANPPPFVLIPCLAGGGREGSGADAQEYWAPRRRAPCVDSTERPCELWCRMTTRRTSQHHKSDESPAHSRLLVASGSRMAPLDGQAVKVVCGAHDPGGAGTCLVTWSSRRESSHVNIARRPSG